jgi:microsomal dipeptidase-like Zn-dependent dipeptidase
VGGYPEFDGWPRFTTMVHQKMYVEWIRRAWQGGLRLMVSLVVNNEALAWGSSGTEPADDRTAVAVQLDEMEALVARHADFLEIARTPSEARRIIRDGRLAMVLGVEVDSLGNWKHEQSVTDDDVRAYLGELYDRGVRHMFPIHLADNAFGGTAVFADEFNFNSAFVHGRFIEVDSSDATGFRLADAPDWLRSPLLGGIADAYPRYDQIGDPAGHHHGHVNHLGLTDRGRDAIAEMMRLGMIVDIDHMSAAAVSDTLALAEARGYPLVAGHVGLSAVATVTEDVDRRTEYQRTPEQIDRIRALGGIVAVGLQQHGVDRYQNAVPNDAPGTSKSWAQAYGWLADRMGGVGVAIGTDINGLAGQWGPRFGLNACPDIGRELPGPDPRASVDAQANGVRYASEVVDYRAYRFEGVREQDVYDMEARDVWESIAIFKSGTDPDQAEMPGLPRRTPWQSGKVRNMAKGFRAASEDELENPFLGGQTFNEQRAAFLVAHGREPDAGEELERARLFGVIKRVWDRWHAMQGDNAPLVRHRAGRRDFDINLDGVAHYGMLPDFLQDLRNVGLSQERLAPLFRSAEDYIRTWERCEQRRGRVPRNAEFVRAEVPAEVQRGRVAQVTVVMRNTGSATWTAADAYRLAVRAPGWDMPTVAPAAPVEAAQEATFKFTITAPGGVGGYELRCQMVHDGGAPFGDLTPARSVSVVDPPGCESVKGEIAGVDAEIAALQADLQGVATGERALIARQIKALRGRRDALVSQADALGCSRG